MKTYVIHVSTNEMRYKHMLGQLEKHACLADYSFVKEGDIKDIGPELHQQFFGGELNEIGPAVSCAYKHLLAFQDALRFEDSNLFLILEDDIYLYRNFCKHLKKIVEEVERRKLVNMVISLEESTVVYVKGSERKRGQILYEKDSCRTTGAYIIDRAAIVSLLTEVEQNKCNRPFDWFFNECVEAGLIHTYWTHPCFAVQGSLNGKMKSLIDGKPVGQKKVWQFRLHTAYKRFLFSIR